MNPVIVLLVAIMVDEASGAGNLRRKRNTFAVPEDATVDRDEFMVKDELKLDNLWNRAIDANLDQEGLLSDRFLQDMSLSMPTPGPTPRPSPMPTTRGPTPAPTTRGPTPEPTVKVTMAPSSSKMTNAPSANCLTGTTRTDFLRAFLSDVSVPAALDDATTSAGMAFNWLTTLDPLMFDPCTFPTIAQRFGLATFFFASQGQSWLRNTGWLGGENECTWFGITCDAMNTTIERLQLRKLSKYG